MKRIFTLLFLATLMCFAVQTAYAEKGGQCVRYVKKQRPGGHTWDKSYPLKVNGKASKTKASWIEAKEIWNKLWVKSRGDNPKKNAVMVLDAFSRVTTGHVAIVTKVSGNKIYVKHSNWCNNNCEDVSTGYFTRVRSNRVTYNGGSTQYPLLGFVYEP